MWFHRTKIRNVMIGVPPFIFTITLFNNRISILQAILKAADVKALVKGKPKFYSVIIKVLYVYSIIEPCFLRVYIGTFIFCLTFLLMLNVLILLIVKTTHYCTLKIIVRHHGSTSRDTWLTRTM